jgi:hypothetical protein
MPADNKQLGKIAAEVITQVVLSVLPSVTTKKM